MSISNVITWATFMGHTKINAIKILYDQPCIFVIRGLSLKRWSEHQLKSDCIHNTVAVRDIIRDNHQVQDILGVINIKAHDSRPDKHLVTLVPLLKERLTYANFLTNF